MYQCCPNVDRSLFNKPLKSGPSIGIWLGADLNHASRDSATRRGSPSGGRTMPTGKLVFAPVMEPLPLTTFRWCVAHTRSSGSPVLGRTMSKLLTIDEASVYLENTSGTLAEVTEKYYIVSV